MCHVGRNVTIAGAAFDAEMKVWCLSRCPAAQENDGPEHKSYRTSSPSQRTCTGEPMRRAALETFSARMSAVTAAAME